MLEGGAPVFESPTGSGKTVILAEIAKYFREHGYSVLLAAHRDQIIAQLAAAAGRHTGERIGYYTSTYTTDDAGIVVTMMPTLQCRKKALPSFRGRVLLLDEAHHIHAKTYKETIRLLQPAYFAGATATPITPTGEGLGGHGITRLIRGPLPRRLMDEGRLCEYDLFAGNAIVDTKGLPSANGDYSAKALEQRIVEVDGDFVRDLKRFNPKLEPTIAVTISVDHAYRLEEEYRQAGISAEVVIGKTAKEDRGKAFDRFSKRLLNVIVSVSLIDEGLDLPEATCLQLIRPTKSLRLWKQLLGRVLRTDKNNPDKKAIIIDHGNCYLALPLPDVPIDWTLEGKVKPKIPKTKIGDNNQVIIVSSKKASGPALAAGNRKELAKINTQAIYKNALEEWADKRKRAARRNLHLVESKGFNPSILWPFANNSDGLGDGERRRIERCLSLPVGYCDPKPIINKY